MNSRIWEAENQRKLQELNARPWRSICRLCPGMMYCTDTEAEAEKLVKDHLATEHTFYDVWEVRK